LTATLPAFLGAAAQLGIAITGELAAGDGDQLDRGKDWASQPKRAMGHNRLQLQSRLVVAISTHLSVVCGLAHCDSSALYRCRAVRFP
jgi:hypothetical protein